VTPTKKTVGELRFAPRFWAHDRHVNLGLRRAVEALIRRHGLVTPRLRVVDLGCGDRPYARLFAAPEGHYVGCDLEPPADVVVRTGEPVDLPTAGADGVVSFQVLEHVWDLDWYLGEARRLLKPGGWLLLSTHGTWLYHPHPTDFRRWTRDGLLQELDARGFAPVDCVAVAGPLAWTTQIRLLGLRHALLKLPLIGRPLVALAAVLMNTRMILEDAVTPASIRDVNASIYAVLCRRRD
jgi:SAM-dependent methyltransferase